MKAVFVRIGTVACIVATVLVVLAITFGLIAIWHPHGDLHNELSDTATLFGCLGFIAIIVTVVGYGIASDMKE